MNPMIHHLRARILSSLLHTPSHRSASRIISPHRLFSAAAPTSPQPFAVEEYLVSNCGLTRAQARKASRTISHLKSPSKPDAVIAFLSDLGVPRSDIAAVAAFDPPFLCASVEKNLAPRVAELADLGLLRDQIARLIPLALSSFRISSLGRNLSFWLSVFDGSFEMLLRALRLNSAILRVDIEKVVMPNLAFLQQCGVSVSEVAFMHMYSSRLFNLKPKSLREAAERVEELGIKLGSRMFGRALALVVFMRKEDVARKMGMLQKIGFSQDDASVIVRKAPPILRLSDEKIKRVMNFLTRDVGLEPPHIAQRPALFMYSLERRLLPRYCVLKVLREKGLLNVECSYYYTASMAEEVFVLKFVLPYKDHVPGLADDYASRCSGKALNKAALQEV
uniref:Uncharacterized protein n=1 Tax=Arundo donax TaxID=35708 RepID=A0A0A8YBX3_ARUDO